MLITLSRSPDGSGFIVIEGEGRSSRVICNAAYQYLHEARQFAASEASRRGWSLVNKVADDVPATKMQSSMKGM